MTPSHCPACPSWATPQFLTNLSLGMGVHYYRCLDCKHVWMTTKDGTIVKHVTPLHDTRPTKAS